MGLFDSRLYPTAMYLLILTISLLIVFNFANVFSNENYQPLKLNEKIEKNLQNYKITGFASKDTSKNDTNKTSENEEIYSEKSYFIYYLILFFIGICILIIFFITLMPVIKSYS